MWADPAVVRFVGGVALSREAAWAWLFRHIGYWGQLGFGFFAIEDPMTGKFPGEVDFQELRRMLTPFIEGTLETGWILLPEAHGKWIAEEAMRPCLGWTDKHLPDSRVTCIIRPNHAASLYIARKLEFRELSISDYTGKPIVLLERPHPAHVRVDS